MASQSSYAERRQKSASLLARLEEFMLDTGTHPSRLGRDLMRDPGFVRELRRGRILRSDTFAVVDSYLESQRDGTVSASGETMNRDSIRVLHQTAPPPL